MTLDCDRCRPWMPRQEVVVPEGVRAARHPSEDFRIPIEPGTYAVSVVFCAHGIVSLKLHDGLWVLAGDVR